MNLRALARTAVAAAVLPATSLAQLSAIPGICPIPCNGTQIVCHHQNGIRNHRGAPATPVLGPNAAAGNVAGDALWKIWGVENGMTRGSGVATFVSWEIGADNTPAAGQGGTGTLTFNLPDLELRPVTLTGFTPGVKEPDMTAVAIYAAAVGTIALPVGGFRINVSILAPAVGAPASCAPTTTLPTLSNADVAMLFLLPPGETAGLPTYYENVQTTTEVSTISNSSTPPGATGNSYSGSVDAVLGAVTHMAINQELYAEMAFYEPTLEAYRQTAGFLAPTQGSGARELVVGDSFFLVSEDWEAGTRAIAGQDRLAAVVLSDTTVGSPLGLPPGGIPGFLVGSLFLPGSTGVVALYPTATTVALLPFTVTLGAGLNCHVPGPAPACGGAGLPSVFTNMQATTATILVPPGLAGATFYAAAFYLNLTTLTIDDGSNTVELLFL